MTFTGLHNLRWKSKQVYFECHDGILRVTLILNSSILYDIANRLYFNLDSFVFELDDGNFSAVVWKGEFIDIHTFD